MAAKIDVQIDCSEQLDESLSSSLKAGSIVTIKNAEDGSLHVCSSSGAVLGSVPPPQAAELLAADYNGHIRTIKRNSENSAIAAIIIRFSKGVPIVQPIVNMPPELEEEEENVAKLSRDQLLQLANNEEIQRYLRDERLQEVIRNIDGAANREAALNSMMKAPNFKEFTDKVLANVAPEFPG